MKKAVLRFDVAYAFFCGTVISAFICSAAVYPRFVAEMTPSASFAPGSKGGDADFSASAPEFTFDIADEYPTGTIPGFPEDDYAIIGDMGGDYLTEGTAMVTALPSYVPPPLSVSARPVKEEDIILKAYRDIVTRSRVSAFFGGIIRSRELADIILDNADKYNIAPSLAFALCWEESRFNVKAVSRMNKNGSIDRGLFQLNNKSFPHIAEQDFFNPRLNALYGLSHLRWCLDTGGSLVAGLAMYNAGTNRVADGGTPKHTLDYVSHVLDSQRRIEELFDTHGVLMIEIAAVEEEPEEEPAPAPERFRLALLTPVSFVP